MRPITRSSILILLSSLSLAATGQEQRLFRDWAASCDNPGSCTLIGLSFVDAERWARLRRERSGDPGARTGPMIVEFAEPVAAEGRWSPWSDENRLFRIVEDKRRCGEAEGGGRASRSSSTPRTKKRQVLERLGRADARTVAGDDARVVAGISLDGASAAMLWVDDCQGRVGSETALVRRGSRRTAALGAPPPLVHVPGGAWRPLGEERARVMAAETESLFAADRCDRGGERSAEESFPGQGDEASEDRDGRVPARVFCYAGADSAVSLESVVPPLAVGRQARGGFLPAWPARGRIPRRARRRPLRIRRRDDRELRRGEGPRRLRGAWRVGLGRGALRAARTACAPGVPGGRTRRLAGALSLPAAVSVARRPRPACRAIGGDTARCGRGSG